MKKGILGILVMVWVYISAFTQAIRVDEVVSLIDLSCTVPDTLVLEDSLPPRPVVLYGGVKIEKLKRLVASLETGKLTDAYSVRNRYGYMGKYQFGRRTLTGLINSGDLVVTQNELDSFLLKPEIQERAMLALIKHNTRIVKNYGLHKYVGKTINGSRITMEGILAGAHLVGPYAVNHYIKSGGSLSPVTVNGVTVRKRDGNGTTVAYYIKQFSV